MTEEKSAVPRQVPKLPTKASEWQRKVKDRRTINDYVTELHLELVDDDKVNTRYLAYLEGVDSGSFVEGSEEADDLFAAVMIRERAAEKQITLVANATAWAIRRSLKVALARFVDGSRSEREAKQIAVPESAAAAD